MSHDRPMTEREQVLEQAWIVLRDLLTELEAGPMSSTFTTMRRIKALRVLLGQEREQRDEDGHRP